MDPYPKTTRSHPNLSALLGYPPTIYQDLLLVFTLTVSRAGEKKRTAKPMYCTDWLDLNGLNTVCPGRLFGASCLRACDLLISARRQVINVKIQNDCVCQKIKCTYCTFKSCCLQPQGGILGIVFWYDTWQVVLTGWSKKGISHIHQVVLLYTVVMNCTHLLFSLIWFVLCCHITL